MEKVSIINNNIKPMINIKLIFLLSIFIIFLFAGCSKSNNSGSVSQDNVINDYEDNVTKYKRKGLKGKAVTNVPPVDYEHSEQTKSKFKEDDQENR